MAVNEVTIYVYEHFLTAEPRLVGYLYVTPGRGSENYAFEYEDKWLAETKMAYMLDPELLPYRGRQYPLRKGIFGVFADASPDRWGRVLMKKREKLNADREGRKPAKLHDSDFLLGVYDETRMGGIRFKLDPKGDFLSDDAESAVPP